MHLWRRLADWYCEGIEFWQIGRVGWVPLSFEEMAKKRERDYVTTRIAIGFDVPLLLVASPDPWPGFRRWPIFGIDFTYRDLFPMLRTELAEILYKHG